MGDPARPDLQDKDYPTEARSLGRTLIRWKHQIAAWHGSHVSNGPTEAVDHNLIKTGEACRLRVHVVPELPDQVTALRRQAQLGAALDHETPVISEVPSMSPPTRSVKAGALIGVGARKLTLGAA